MSEENVETFRRALEAWNADDLDAFLAELDPEGEWHPSIEPALEGGETVYRGHDGVRKAWDNYRGGAWERLTLQVQEIRDLGESVLVLGHIDLTARTTGIEFSEEVGMLLDLPSGKVLSRDFLSHAEALKPPGCRSRPGIRSASLGARRRSIGGFRGGCVAVTTLPHGWDDPRASMRQSPSWYSTWYREGDKCTQR